MRPLDFHRHRPHKALPRLLGSVLAAVCLAVGTAAAQKYMIRNYSPSDGLAHSEVITIMQDSRGYLWFGTWGGASRFDGLTFQNFSKKDGLAHNGINCIREDSEHNLWFGTGGGGMSRYDGHSWRTWSHEEGLVHDFVMDMLITTDDKLWCFGRSEGVSRLDGERWRNFRVEDGLGSNTVNTLYEDHQGRLWCGTACGASVFDGGVWRTLRCKDGLAGDSVDAVMQDRSGRMWFSIIGAGVSLRDGDQWRTFTTADGLISNTGWLAGQDSAGDIWYTAAEGISRFDGEKWTSYPLREAMRDKGYRKCLFIQREDHPEIWIPCFSGALRFDGRDWLEVTAGNGLTSNNVYCAQQDNEGNLWFGTIGGGVCKFPTSECITYTKKDGLADDMVVPVFEDSRGNYWFGTYGHGLTRYDGKRYTTFTVKDGLPSDYIKVIIEDGHGELWIGTYDSGISRFDGSRWRCYYTSDGLPSNKIVALDKDSRGRILVGTTDGAACFDGHRWETLGRGTGLDGFGVYAVRADSNDVWFGTYGRGVYILKDGARWDSLSTRDGLISDFILEIFLEHSVAWIGTEDGLSRFDGESSVNFNSSNGLPNDRTNCILRDGQFLYIATDGGASRFDGRTFQTLTTRDGLPDNVLRKYSTIRDSHGYIWFGTSAGVARFSPGSSRSNRVPPPVYITRVSAPDNLEVADGNVLKYNRNNLTFEFEAVCFTEADEVKYYYKLEGQDEQWRFSRLRLVQYTNLPPGDYVFRVLALNSDGVWSDSAAEFKFRLTPAFWNTWWFKALSILALALLMGEWHRKRAAKKMAGMKVRMDKLSRDVIERMKAEQALLEERSKLRTALDHEQLLSRVASRLNSVNSVRECIEDLLAQVVCGVGVDCAALYTYDENKRWAVRLSHWCMRDENRQNDCTPVRVSLGGEVRLAERLSARTEVVLDGRVLEDPRTRLFECGHDYSTVLLTPLTLVGEVKGFIGYFSLSERSWQDEEINLFMTTSHVVAGAWERDAHFRARLEAEEKRVEAIRIAEKASHLASIGEMAAAITHEINQPLTTINFAIERLFSWDRENRDILPEMFRKRMKKISDGVIRIDEIIRHMRSFWVSSQGSEKKKIDLNRVVRNANSLVNCQLNSHGVEQEIVLSRDPLVIEGSPIQLENVVINLVVNAMQSIDAAGRAEKKLRISTWRENSTLLLQVEDNGLGLPDVAVETLFEPFFTTKRPNEGTGLGLAIVKRFVERHDGTITVRNNPGGGATFTIRFPAAADTDRDSTHEDSAG
ncbi:GHKL domain-containing protein [bacterium]|nr:GHKL domain-containing protein [bacterium]